MGSTMPTLPSTRQMQPVAKNNNFFILIFTCIMFIEAKQHIPFIFLDLWFNTFRYCGLLILSCSLTTQQEGIAATFI